MKKASGSSIFVVIVAYVPLSFIMVISKCLEHPSVNGDGYSYIANLLGLVLLLPWIALFPGGRLGEGINSPMWFFALSMLNLFLLIGIYVVKVVVEDRRRAKSK